MTDLPSYKLVQRLMHETGFPVADPNDEMVFPGAKFMKLASRLIQYGADQELEACCLLLDRSYGTSLRAARRPKPPSLNSIALQMLGTVERDAHYIPEITDTIRRALEALPND